MSVQPSNIECTTSFPESATQSVVSSITLPNNQQYLFSYDSTYGYINKITYPTGGYVSYSWGFNPLGGEAVFTGGTKSTCIYAYDMPAVLHRYVSFDGINIALQQDFSYSTTWNTTNAIWTSKQTTVTTHDLLRGTAYQTIYVYNYVSSPYVPYIYTFSDRQIPVEQTVSYYGVGGTLLRTVTKAWFDQYELGCELTTLDNGQVSGTFYSYGVGGQVTDKKEYDYGLITSASACEGSGSTVSSPPSGVTPTRETAYTYQSFPDTPVFPGGPSIFDRPSSVITYGNGTRMAETDFSYDQTSTLCVGSPNCVTPTGHDETNYSASSTSPRGNATTRTRQCFQGSTGCTNSVATSTFDETGQLLSTTDPCGNAACSDITGPNHTTSYSYADNYASGTGTPPGQTNTFLTQTTFPQTNSVNHIVKFSYGYADGQNRTSVDQNNLTTSFQYNDPLVRPTQINYADTGQAPIAYNDTSLTVTASRTINASQAVTTVSVFDGLGHTKQTQLTTDPQGIVYTDHSYDGLGRAYTVSNPYRSGGDPTSSPGTTTFVYDALGRKTSQTYPDGSVLTTAYCGPSTLVTDPTGRWRRSRSDALGRLVEVDEPNAVGATVNSNGCPGQSDPIWITSYSYDALGNLISVVQNGSHQRNFTYDSLSHLLTSTSPEVGAITYTYDANGNVATKTDARGITTTYTYDVLNRELSATYSNGDATITTAYDQSACLGLSACQNVGHATSRTDGAGSEAWAYQVDSANQRSIHVNQRTTNSSPSNITKTSTYYFDLAGNLTSITYPTGRVVNYTYDAANRSATSVDSSNGITYAAAQVSPPSACPTTNVCYTPQSTEYSAAIGKTSSFNGINFSETYNNRLQPLEIKAGPSSGNVIDLTYSFLDPTTSKNAGHVNSITNNLDSTRSQTFSYDQLNRIAGALTASTYASSAAHCWGESYTVDPWGNLNSIAATTNSSYTGCSQESGFSTTADGNNHLPLFGYDTSGNTQYDGSISYTYNAESQIKTANGVTYLYDGAGRRVSKSNGKLYWYGSGGEILAETDASGNILNEYVFFGGRRVAMLPAGGNAQYYVEDLLGTSRVMTTNTGTLCYDGDFYPYGGERTYTNACPAGNNYKFEGKERDAETGNDDFGARYYSNSFGRWLSADWSSVPVPVPYADLTNPQTLNLYAMASDDPETSADLDGHTIGCDPSKDKSCDAHESDQQKGKAAAQQKPAEQTANQQQSGTSLTPKEQREAIKQALDLTMTFMTMFAFEAANMGGSEENSSAAPEATAAETTAANAAESAADRANTIAGAMGKTKDFATIAVTETEEGVVLVSSSENDRGLRPAALASLKEGEVAVEGQGHAEVTGLNAAKEMGLTPTGVAASRPICPGCWDAIKAAGAVALSVVDDIKQIKNILK
jgi:RHS repeat-associated protein